ncbi:methyltransferase domain-containing protein [Coxiella endosymbiont of Amblyomma americanum]|uniref:methyltransferase domain-containing protein n=1 Tax=Coxiella endosymbiont of Amblyomma americanum TaxID=325775 RepID=UPI00057EADF9|nr:methyltransferase domain-containing protein [Coxiella endosymbiont of Amblyomma americanum]AJC50682.1 bioC.2 [Coxiella endosymbiont of Amblyomma americanum]AUJ58940.1 SAM-dependent methyltransferase [Coxiella-like endosymbiont of Amblyomma americanum]
MLSEKKIRIQRSFNKAFKTYDNYSDIPKKICNTLLNQLKKIDSHYEIIADFACGTGISTQAISLAYLYKNLYAIDFCNNLLNTARRKIENSNVMFILADFDDFLFFENSIHLIFCNMGLQWSLNLKNTFKVFSYQLIRSGIMAFSIPLKGTFDELDEKSRNQFYQPNVITNLLVSSGFSMLSCQEINFTDTFNTVQSAIRSIKCIGANCLIQKQKSSLSIKPILKPQSINKQPVKLTYRIGFFICKKI